jgi:CheY-like chemotaxis protein
VLTASSGDAALEFIHSDVPIDLLFTDVVMPGKIKSVELARRAAARSPAVPTLFTSGYTRDEIVHHGKLDAGITLLSKPYRRDDLARKLRSVLRASAGPVASVTHVGKMTDREIAACVPPVAYDPSSVEMPGVEILGVEMPGVAARRREALQEVAPEVAPARSPAHVLLVEDDADSREALSSLLGALGLDCTSVASAEEALPLVPAQRYDILCTDITLPGMSGDNLARAVLRAQPDVQVLLVSGYGAHAPIGDSIPGARMLGKPLDIAQLRRELAQWLDPIEAAS